MNRVVVDTNIVSYVFKRDTRAGVYTRHLEGRVLAISFMTLAELYRWAFERNWSPKNRELLASHLRNYVVIPFDNELCVTWARIVSDAKSAGVTINPSDAWVAASALRYGAPLVTHNRKCFEAIRGLRLISESP